MNELIDYRKEIYVKAMISQLELDKSIETAHVYAVRALGKFDSTFPPVYQQPSFPTMPQPDFPNFPYPSYPPNSPYYYSCQHPIFHGTCNPTNVENGNNIFANNISENKNEQNG